MRARTHLGFFCVVLSAVTAFPVVADWTQWGGDSGDFSVDANSLPRALPEPPKLVWQRELGDGESAVLVEGGALYTLYRDGDEEVVVALAAADGKVLWEHRYAAAIPEGMYVEHGKGPHATPVLAGDRICSMGITGSIRCLQRKTGKLLWSHEAVGEFGGQAPDCGYSSSPLVHDEALVVPVGGKRSGVVAFRIADGSVAWKAQDFAAGYAPPMLIDVQGETQLVVFMREEVAGLDPKNGTLLWSHPHKTSYGVNASQPVWGSDGILFISSAYDQGSRGLKLQRKGDKTTVEEIWTQRKMKLHFTNAVRIGNHLFGTSGDFGPVFLTAIDSRTGEISWRARDVVSKATILHAGPRVLMMDEKGKLVLATLSPEGVKVHAEHPLVEGRVWAPPTLVGHRLYVRNRNSLYVFQLG